MYNANVNSGIQISSRGWLPYDQSIRLKQNTGKPVTGMVCFEETVFRLLSIVRLFFWRERNTLAKSVFVYAYRTESMVHSRPQLFQRQGHTAPGAERKRFNGRGTWLSSDNRPGISKGNNHTNCSSLRKLVESGGQPRICSFFTGYNLFLMVGCRPVFCMTHPRKVRSVFSGNIP